MADAEARTKARRAAVPDGMFATPDGGALPPADPPPVAERADALPLPLTTGRLRDQWHGMVRTGTMGRLFGHAPEPRSTPPPTTWRRSACARRAGAREQRARRDRAAGAGRHHWDGSRPLRRDALGLGGLERSRRRWPAAGRRQRADHPRPAARSRSSPNSSTTRSASTSPTCPGPCSAWPGCPGRKRSACSAGFRQLMKGIRPPAACLSGASAAAMLLPRGLCQASTRQLVRRIEALLGLDGADPAASRGPQAPPQPPRSAAEPQRRRVRLRRRCCWRVTAAPGNLARHCCRGLPAGLWTPAAAARPHRRPVAGRAKPSGLQLPGCGRGRDPPGPARLRRQRQQRLRTTAGQAGLRRRCGSCLPALKRLTVIIPIADAASDLSENRPHDHQPLPQDIGRGKGRARSSTVRRPPTCSASCSTAA